MDFSTLMEAITPGEAVTLEAGDAAYLPANSGGEIRNDGQEPVVALGFLVVPPGGMMAEATPGPVATIRTPREGQDVLLAPCSAWTRRGGGAVATGSRTPRRSRRPAPWNSSAAPQQRPATGSSPRSQGCSAHPPLATLTRERIAAQQRSVWTPWSRTSPRRCTATRGTM